VSSEIFGFLAGVRGRIPLLRYLRISIGDYSGMGSRSPQQIHPFEIAPELRDVTVEDIDRLSRGITLPFDQLTRLKGTFNDQVPITTLQRTPNLEAASLNFEDDPQSNGPLIHLPLLRCLFVSSLNCLDLFLLPALGELYMIDAHPAPLLSLLARSPTAKLKTLRIKGCSSPNIATILAACPTTQTFGVQILSRDKGDDLVRELTVRSPGGVPMCIGPNINFIAFALDGGCIDENLFVNMVESRWRVPTGGPCCRLRAVELLILQDDSPVGTGITHRLKILEDEGLRVSALQGFDATDAHFSWQI
jgi:hypothetical protein